MPPIHMAALPNRTNDRVSFLLVGERAQRALPFAAPTAVQRGKPEIISARSALLPGERPPWALPEASRWLPRRS
jgi:hypothetical protein